MAPRAKRQNQMLDAFDRDLEDLPADLRWREWMRRVEAVIFASPEPVPREILTKVVGEDCNLDHLIEQIRDELRGRPYELIFVAGGFQHRTKRAYTDAIQIATRLGKDKPSPSKHETLVLMAIAYFQPLTRAELGILFGREISRDTIGSLRAQGFIASGPRSPTPGAPYTYVTTATFLSSYGFESLRDLPDMERLEDAGLLGKEKWLSGNLPGDGKFDNALEDIDSGFEVDAAFDD
jgi:segregation and condensation protein B